MYVKNCELKKPVSCHENDSITKVSKILRDHHLRNIVIVNDAKNPIGIVSSVDIVNKIIAEGKNYNEIKAKEVMNPALYVNENDEVSKAYIQMLKCNTYSFPVVSSEDKFIGVLSFTQAVKHLSKKAIKEVN